MKFDKKTIILCSIIAFLLAVVIFFLAGGMNLFQRNQDNTNDPSKLIYGKWVTVGANRWYIEFNADGTGSLDYDGVADDFKWKYDAELDQYEISVLGKPFYVTLKEDGEMTYVYLDSRFYRENDLQEAEKSALNYKKNYVDKKLNGKPLLPLNEKIKVNDDMDIKFTEITFNKETNILTLQFTLENTSQEPMVRTDMETKLNRLLRRTELCHSNDGFGVTRRTGDSNIIDSFFNHNDIIEPGSVCENKGTISFGSDWKDALEYWGECHGYVIITINEVEYFINMEEFFK